jgi:hypothetical protein
LRRLCSGRGRLRLYVRFGGSRICRRRSGISETKERFVIQVVASLGGFEMHMQVTLRMPRDPDGRIGLSAIRLIWGSRSGHVDLSITFASFSSRIFAFTRSELSESVLRPGYTARILDESLHLTSTMTSHTTESNNTKSCWGLSASILWLIRDCYS